MGDGLMSLESMLDLATRVQEARRNGGVLKGKITHVGTFGFDGQPTGWEFDCLELVPCITVLASGETLLAGYSKDELWTIMTQGTQPSAG